MSSRQDHDPSLERLLKATLPGTMLPASSSACVDAETLAAWSEGGLSRSDAGQVEVHLAGCARCQSMLAAFARTEPVAAATAPFWQRWSIRVLIPIAAAAAAVVVWVAVRDTPPRPVEMARLEAPVMAPEAIGPGRPTDAARQDESRSAAAGSPLPPAVGRLTQGEASTQGKQDTERGTPQTTVGAPLATPDAIRQEPAPSVPTSTEAARPPAIQSSPQQAVGGVTSLGAVAERSADATPPTRSETASATRTATQAPTAAAARAAQERADAERQPAAPTTTGGRAAAGAASSTANTYKMLDALVDRRAPIAEIVSARPTIISRSGGRGGAGRGRAGAQEAGDVPPTRWRVFAGGLVERSTTDGASWQAASMDAPAVVTTGASPSDSVCWLIGPGGVVLLTTDGLRFERVDFPDQSELISITAFSARQATVRTADGRAFGTSDGGASWQAQ